MFLFNILKSEFRLIKRDALLFLLLIFVIYMGVVLHFLLPWANGYLEEKNLLPGTFGTDYFSQYYPVILAFMVLLTGAQLAGTIFAVLILNDKDDQTIKALLVSPLSSKSYIMRRTGLAIFFGLIFILAMFYMINIDMLPLWQILTLSVGAALTAPLIMLFLAILSESKVQGMSYAKFISLIGFILIISWFVPGKLQILFGILPPYWIFKSYWLALEQDITWLLYLGIGIFYQGLLTYILTRVFQKKIYQNIL